jgi:hypothetical protein
MTSPSLNTYGGNLLDAAYSGMIANMVPNTIISLSNEAAQVIDFGYAVVRGAANDTCKAPSADGDVVIGISVRNSTIHAATTAGEVTYTRYDSVAIMREGYIHAVAAENTTRGTGVLSLTAQFGKLGAVSAGAAGAGRVAVTNATWETTTTAGSVGLVRINQ